MAMQAVSTCGLYYVARLTSGRAFSRFRVHSCPELAALLSDRTPTPAPLVPAP